jgi:beta-galactosidase
MSVSGLGVITRSQDSFAVFTAGSNDRIYGDNYKIDSDGNVSGIGNNVVLEFHGMDFGEKGASRLKIRGSTMNGANSIRINHGDCEQLIEFGDSYCFCEQVFEIERLYGKSDLRFTFLPGSNFNFAWFKFEE